MAQRFVSTYKSDKGKSYTLNIYDNNFSGQLTKFKCDPSSAVLATGSGQRIFERTIPTKFTFSMFVNQESIKTFLDQIQDLKETDIIVELLDASDGKLFKGYLSVDGVRQPESSINYFVKMTATDGIGRLRNMRIDFDTYHQNDNEIISLYDVLTVIFKQSKLDELYVGGEVWLKSRLPFYEQNLYTEEGDTLNNYFVSRFAFANKRRTRYETCLKCIQMIMSAFNGRFYYSNGTYIIDNIRSIAYWQYEYRTYFKISRGSGIEVIQNNVASDWVNITPLANGGFEYIAEPRLVEILFKGGGENNLAGHILWNLTSLGQTSNLGYVIQGDIISTLIFNFVREAVNNSRYYIYAINLEVNGYYLKVDISNLSIEWTNDPNDMIFIYGQGSNFPEFAFTDIKIVADNNSIIIPPIPSDGYLKITLSAFQQFDGTSNESIPVDFDFKSTLVKILLNGQADSNEVQYTALVDANNTSTISVDMYLGDISNDYTSSQRLYYDEGGEAFKPTHKWNGTDQSLQFVNLDEIAKIHNSTLKVYDGTFWIEGAIEMLNNNRILHRGIIYYFLSVTVNTGKDEISGRWVEVLDAEQGKDQGVFNPPFVNPNLINIPTYSSLTQTISKKKITQEFLDVQLDFVELTKFGLPDMSKVSISQFIESYEIVVNGIQYDYSANLSLRNGYRVESASRIMFSKKLRGSIVRVSTFI